MKKNITIINDNKFRSVFISVNFMRKLDKKETGKNALLASVLKKGTEKLKTEKEIELELAKLYSSTIDINVEKIGGIYNVEFGAEFINKKYIDEDVSGQVIDLLYDVIYKPLVVNSAFEKETFDIEKEALIEKINQEKNDKRRWALRRLEEEMYNENDYGVSVYGNIEDIEKEDEKTIYNYYLDFIKTCEINIVVTGNLDGYDNLETKLSEKFLSNSIEIIKLDIVNRENLRKCEDYEKLNQSVLCLGLNVKAVSKQSKPAVAVYANILGGTPSSKLFQNVREKESLAYFAKAQYIKYINAIYVYCGINLCNVDKATSVIYKQLEDIKNGNITEDEIDTAKKNIILTYKSLSDNKVAFNRSILANRIYNDDFDIDEYIQSIEKITIEDVKNIANSVEVNTIYLLGGKIDE